jgi:hypothetical protein
LASVDPDDFDQVERTVRGEARGEPPLEAVVHVIANRAEQSGMSPGEVVKARGPVRAVERARRELEALDQRRQRAHSWPWSGYGDG